MGITHETGWAWIGVDGKPQANIFNTPNEAIAEMQRRQGNTDFCIQRALDIGFKLAFVKVTVEPLMILDKPAAAT